MRSEKRETSNRKSDSGESSSVSPLRRFEKSMEIDYEKWHDGIGYDLDAIKLASQTEREAIEQMLIHHSPRDWRDIEALAQIDTENARETIKNAIKDPDPAVRVAVTRYAPNLVTNSETKPLNHRSPATRQNIRWPLTSTRRHRRISPNGSQGSTYKGIIELEKAMSQSSSLRCSSTCTEKQKSPST